MCNRRSAPSRRAFTDSYEYDAFGNQISHTGTTPNEMLYRGEEWDSDLGLYYLRARYYNPLTGRFMSRDPNQGHIRDPKSLHKYLYADGDPINLADPVGRGALVDFTINVAKEIVKVPTVAQLTIEVTGCLLGLADTALTFSKRDWPTPIGVAGTALACGLYELHSILYIAALIP